MQKQPQRSFIFHWLANILFASVALFAGLIFGEKIPRDKLGMAFAGVALVALAMVPLTRRWEKAGIAKRQQNASNKTAGGSPDRNPGDSEPSGLSDPDSQQNDADDNSETQEAPGSSSEKSGPHPEEAEPAGDRAAGGDGAAGGDDRPA